MNYRDDMMREQAVKFRAAAESLQRLSIKLPRILPPVERALALADRIGSRRVCFLEGNSVCHQNPDKTNE